MTAKVELIDGDATFGLRIELAGGNAIDLLIDKGQGMVPRASLWSGNVEFLRGNGGGRIPGLGHGRDGWATAAREETRDMMRMID